MTYSAFFYGSLMSKNVLSRVLCGAEASEHDKTLKLQSVQLRSTILKGYMRSALKGEEYPAMVHTGNDQNYVSGVFCQNLTVKDLNSLDVFEGEYYGRVPVQVQDENGDLFDTEAYIWLGELDQLTGTEWSFEGFITSGREQRWLDERCDFYEVDKLHRI